MNLNCINNSFFQENGLPLVKKGNLVCITKINSFIFICRIASLMITLPAIIFLFFVIFSSKSNPEAPMIIIMIATAVIVLACLGFGVTQKLIFDLHCKKVYLENRFITYVSNKTLCDFKDINMIGITSYKEKYHDKYGEKIYVKSSMVLATKYNPLDLIEFLNANFISYTIDPAKFTMIAKIIVVITGCTNFIDGGTNYEIKAERNYQTKEVEYELSLAPTREQKLFSF